MPGVRTPIFVTGSMREHLVRRGKFINQWDDVLAFQELLNPVSIIPEGDQLINRYSAIAELRAATRRDPASVNFIDWLIDNCTCT